MVSLCYTLHGLHSNADVTLGGFGIDAGDRYWSVLCLLQTDDRVEYIRCLDAVLYTLSSTALAQLREYMATSMHSYPWSGLPCYLRCLFKVTLPRLCTTSSNSIACS